MTANPPTLRWLAFEASESDDGTVTFDAEAAVRTEGADAAADSGRADLAADLASLDAEVAAVLAWAQAALPGDSGPLEDGHAWDMALQRHASADGWVTVALTLSGGAALAEAFHAAFDAAGGAGGHD